MAIILTNFLASTTSPWDVEMKFTLYPLFRLSIDSADVYLWLLFNNSEVFYSNNYWLPIITSKNSLEILSNVFFYDYWEFLRNFVTLTTLSESALTQQTCICMILTNYLASTTSPRLYLVLSGCICLYLYVSGCICLYLFVSGRIWSYLLVSGRICLYLVVSDCICLYLSFSMTHLITFHWRWKWWYWT